MKWLLKLAEKAIRKLSTPLPIKELAFQIIRFLVACGKSHPVSFMLRPLADSNYLRLVPGLVLVVGVLWWATPFSFSSGVGGQAGINLGSEPEVTIETQVSTQLPIEEYVLTQRYSFVHSGYDMAAPTGTRIRPVMAGKIIEVKKNWYGYGNMILIDHQNGYQSRYGHLSQIWVNEGQGVDLGTTLGLVGSTGRSTGPHLHLEIIENGRLVNPKVVLGI